ncbi:calcium/proton exchanger [Tanacetum coccineum]
MSFNDLHDVVSHLVLVTVKRLYYCSIKSELKDGIKELKTDKDVEDFLRVGYENKWFVNLYTEHHDYDVLDFLTIEGNVNETPYEFSDDYYSSDEVKEIDYVDFHTEEPIDDPDAASIDPLFKVKRGVSYPKHDPTIPWNEMQPVLGMRYEHPEQLKLALANYGVANGYQLWYMRNDWRCMLVYCGRNVEAGRCVGMYSNKKYVAKRKLFDDDSPRTPVKKGRPVKKAIRVKKSVSFSPNITKSSFNSGEGCSKHGEGTIKDAEKSPQSPKWIKSKIISDKKQGPVCGFRLWASWMTTEQSFQIKSLHPEHKCSKNYKLGSLVTYKWIAHQFAKDIINDPFMPYIKLKDAIRKKFMIDDYRQALLESNPCSTCRLDMEDTGCDKSYFKRFYICFKRMKDGWFEGCRRVIGLDGCFLKHTCRGELLTAMGRDANNQMYLIAWAVVRVENSDNWCWFLALLHDDLKLQQGTGLTLISDGHKGLHKAVRD